MKTIVIWILAALLAVGGGAYIYINAQKAPESGNTNTAGNSEPVIAWKFTSAGETDSIPYTSVSVTVDGKIYDMGKFQGSCSEVGASGGIDGKGLLAGELSAAQCWFAGGGDEIGVFAHEDGGYDIMVGGLSEGEEGSPMFRGDFKIKNSIEL